MHVQHFSKNFLHFFNSIKIRFSDNLKEFSSLKPPNKFLLIKPELTPPTRKIVYRVNQKISDVDTTNSLEMNDAISGSGRLGNWKNARGWLNLIHISIIKAGLCCGQSITDKCGFIACDKKRAYVVSAIFAGRSRRRFPNKGYKL